MTVSTPMVAPTTRMLMLMVCMAGLVWAPLLGEVWGGSTEGHNSQSTCPAPRRSCRSSWIARASSFLFACLEMLEQMGCWSRNGIKRYENVVSEICPECNARIKVVQYAMQCKTRTVRRRCWSRGEKQAVEVGKSSKWRRACRVRASAILYTRARQGTPKQNRDGESG